VIESRDNDRLKRVRKLLGARKHREQTGLFACEGEDLVEAARVAGIEPVDLLTAGENVAPELLASVSTLPHPARVIGVYSRSALPGRPRPVCLALWRLADPGNVGTLLRTADAFGAAVALSDGCADPVSPKALRASAGAIFSVPLVPWDASPARRVALVPRGGAPLADVDLSPPVTFVLGAERDGLPDDLVTMSDEATIPLARGAESLNVAAAGAIALYELSRRMPGS
jgi:TrmH family RNA methyltransferase